MSHIVRSIKVDHTRLEFFLWRKLFLMMDECVQKKFLMLFFNHIWGHQKLTNINYNKTKLLGQHCYATFSMLYLVYYFKNAPCNYFYEKYFKKQKSVNYLD